MSIFDDQCRLYAAFEGKRASIACRKCLQPGTLEGVAPSMTSLARANCSNCKTLTSVSDLAGIPAATPAPDRTNEALVVEIRNLNKTIQQLLASNKRLEVRVAELERPKSKSTPFTFQPPTIRTTVIPKTPLVSQTDFLPVETTQKPLPTTWAAKTSAYRPRQKATTSARTIAAKARLFQEPSGPQRYEYVYLPRSRRMTRPEARSSLRKLGLDTSRILDLILPTRATIGILLHVQYKATVLEQLKKHKINTIDNFDPEGPKHVADPKHENLPLEERTAMAKRLHHDRIVRALRYMRPTVARAVGRSFVDQGWIAIEDLAGLPHSDRDTPALAFIANSPQPSTLSATRHKRRALSIVSEPSEPEIIMSDATQANTQCE